ncbi:MAG: prephenate dehydratase [Candidatus Pacebacteria bacterium]|nr:prephenate dehydratase [Candidatus Paceibacterota bacterium]
MSVKAKKGGNFGVLGPEGSYSHEASIQYDKNIRPIFFDTIGGIIDAIANGKLSQAILPLENSIHGTVLETLDGIFHNKLKIIEESIVDIRHALAGVERIVSPKNIDFIYSHSQALAQSARYLKKHYPKAKLVLTESTSASFKKIKDEQLKNALAIGPKLGAKIYNLNILAEDIQDEKNNQTRFAIVSKVSKTKKILPYILLVIAPTKDRPGLLYDILAVFKDNNVNLAKLESRPTRNKLGSYIFYIKAEISGKDKKAKGILKKLNKFGKVTVMTN